MRLTFAELEAATCTGLARLLALNLASIAGEESCCLECGTICLLVNLAEGAGDSETDGLSLTFDTAAVDGNLDVKLAKGSGNIHRLVYDITQRLEGEIHLERTVIDRNVAFAG